MLPGDNTNKLETELDHVMEELEKIAVVNLLQHRSIISLIGNVQRSSLILEKAFHVLRTNAVNVQMISQGASKVNMSLIVNDHEAERCVRALHSTFFERERELLSEFDSTSAAQNGSAAVTSSGTKN
ncbi:GTP:AMP phosphotransferase ak3, mitochondrial [Asimina triloba]